MQHGRGAITTDRRGDDVLPPLPKSTDGPQVTRASCNPAARGPTPAPECCLATSSSSILAFGADNLVTAFMYQFRL